MALSKGVPANVLDIDASTENEIRSLEDKKKKVEERYNTYASKYKHLSEDPSVAIALGAEIEKRQSLQPKRMFHIQFGEGKESENSLFERAIDEANAQDVTNIYEIKGNQQSSEPISKKTLSKKLTKEELSGLYFDPKFGMVAVNKNGDKFSIQTNNAYKNLSKEAYNINNYLQNMADIDPSTIIQGNNVLDERGNIIGGVYNQSVINAIKSYGKPIPGTKNMALTYRDWETDRKSTRLNSSHSAKSRMPSSA